MLKNRFPGVAVQWYFCHAMVNGISPGLSLGVNEIRNLKTSPRDRGNYMHYTSNCLNNW